MSKQTRIITPRVILQMFLFIIIAPLLPLLISWQWNWWEAWIYGLSAILGFVLSRALAARRNPDLLAERARFLHLEDAKPWDRILAPLVGLGGALVPLVIGLDARLDWSPGFTSSVNISALVLMVAGYVLSSYALIENRFFSGMVRIQTERGHKAVTGGPYRWMRHPGYSGALLAYLTTPFFLDSAWALVPAILLAVTLVIRTALEDRTLQTELEGYREYAGRVRYRLLPGVW